MELCARTLIEVRVARSPADVAAHHAVREAVFVSEQRIFEGHDRDAWDEGAVKVVATIAGRVVGAVRLYPLDEAGLWKGDRLAVLPDARTLGVGAPLVRFAVATAGAAGGTRMIALIQKPNVAFFRRLGWTRHGDPSDFRGTTHQPMSIALAGSQPEFAPTGYQWALPTT
jgi:putative N-acetyltransferase (TIGR04045 family)